MWLVLLTTAAGLGTIQQTEGATHVVVWDTGGRFVDVVDAVDRAGWKPVPLQLKTQPARVSRCEILRNGGDEVALEVFFSAQGSAEVSRQTAPHISQKITCVPFVSPHNTAPLTGMGIVPVMFAANSLIRGGNQLSGVLLATRVSATTP